MLGWVGVEGGPAWDTPVPLWDPSMGTHRGPRMEETVFVNLPFSYAWGGGGGLGTRTRTFSNASSGSDSSQASTHVGAAETPIARCSVSSALPAGTKAMTSEPSPAAAVTAAAGATDALATTTSATPEADSDEWAAVDLSCNARGLVARSRMHGQCARSRSSIAAAHSFS
jgi:hypothetical protein